MGLTTFSDEEMIYIYGQFAFFDATSLVTPESWLEVTVIVVYNNDGSTTVYEAIDYNNDDIIDELIDATYAKNYRTKN